MEDVIINQDMRHTKKLAIQIHLIVATHGMQVCVYFAAGPVADRSQACGLIDKIAAGHLLVGK